MLSVNIQSPLHGEKRAKTEPEGDEFIFIFTSNRLCDFE